MADASVDDAFVASFFEELQGALREHAAVAAGLAGVIKFYIPGRLYAVSLDAKTVSAVGALRPHESEPGVTVLQFRSATVFRHVFERRVSPNVAWLRGDMVVSGDLSALPRLAALFDMFRAHLARRRERQSTPDARGSMPASLHRNAVSPSWTARASGVSAPRLVARSRWIPDTDKCQSCAADFDFTRRRHHCRYCGRCICSACSRMRLAGRRACLTCFISSTSPASAALSRPAASASSVERGSVHGEGGDSPALNTSGVVVGGEAHASQAAVTGAGVADVRSAHAIGGRAASLPAQELGRNAAGVRRSSLAGVVASSTHTLHGYTRRGVGTVEDNNEAGDADALTAHQLDAAHATISALQAETNELQSHVRALREAALQATTPAWMHFEWVARTAFLLACVFLSAALLYWHAAVPSVLLAALVVFVIASAYAYALPSSLLVRRLRAFYTAAVVLLQLVQLRRCTAHMTDAESAPIWDAMHNVLARVAATQMCALQAFWIKIAQYASTRADVFPAAYIRELSKLQDATTPSSIAAVRATVRAALGVDIDTVFAEFHDKPLASASIAQVHRATLRKPVALAQPAADVTSGATVDAATPPPAIEVRHVVVKVQHPGIASIMMSDLTTLRVIVNVVAYLEPEFDFRPVIAEWASEAVKELDFRREAAITMHAGATLAQAQLHCAVPGVVPLAAVSSAVARDVTAAPNVLLLEHVDGVKVTDVAAITAAGADLAQLMLDICEAFSVQMHVDGCFHGDPHAGNLLVRLPALGSGRLPATASGVHREPFAGGERSAPTVSNLVRAQPVLLDWGLTKILTDRHRLAFCSMAVAASESDGGALLDSFDAMGLKLNREAPHEDLNNIQFLMRDAAPATQARAAIMAQRAVWKARVAARAAAGAPRRPVDAWPNEILFYLRTGEMLHGLAATLQVHLAYSSVMAKYARTALRGHAAATWLVQQPAAAHTPALKPLLPAATLRVPPSGVHDVVVLDSARSHACAAMCAMMRRAAVPGVMPVFARVPATFSSAVEERVYVLLRQLWISGAIVGAQVAVYQAGARLVDASFGELGGNNVRPVTSATLFNVFSVSKAVTATLLHVLMDRIHQREAQPAAAAHETSASTLAQEYGALVSAFWPAFVPPSAGGGASPSAVALKRRTTLVHVLQHTAGLQHAIPADVNMSKFVDCEAMMRALEEAVPDTIPGAHTSYHYYTFGWLVAGLVRGMQARALGSEAAHLSFAECLYHALLAPAGLAREMLMSLPYPSSDGSGEDVDASRVATLAGDFSSMGGVAVGTSASSLAPELATAAEVARYDASPSGIDSHDGAPTPARTLLEGSTQRFVTGGAPSSSASSSAATSLSALVAMLNKDDEPTTTALPPLDADTDTTPEAQAHRDALAMQQLVRRLRDKLYLLDPRLFNRRNFRAGTIPAANLHTTARALARFYALLGGTLHAESLNTPFNVDGMDVLPLMSPQRLQHAVTCSRGEHRRVSFFMQGEASQHFGLGYQVYSPGVTPSASANTPAVASIGAGLPAQGAAFGHSGFGGSIGLYDANKQLAVGVTVNWLTTGKAATKAVLELLHNELGLVRIPTF